MKCLGLAIGLALSGLVLQAATAEAAIIVRNGGDVVISEGGDVQMFDQVEYLEAFSPASQGEAWNLIDTRLQLLGTKFPRTAGFLKRTMVGGDTLWWFVNARLREIEDEGNTAVIVSDEMQQIAANTGGIVQIRKDYWDRMNAKSRSVLMMHEALWTAIGNGYIADGSGVRLLSSLILSTPLENIPASQLAQFLKRPLSPQSPLYQYVELDIQNGYVSPVFTVNEVEGPMSRDLVVSARGVGANGSLMLTKLNPDPRAAFIYRTMGKPYTFFAEVGVDGGIPTQVRIRDLCKGLRYGGPASWRLPSVDELFQLHRAGMMNVRHVTMPHVFKFVPGQGIVTITSPMVYPNPSASNGWYPLLLLSSEGRVLDMNANAADVTASSSNSSEYVYYICVAE